MKLKTLAVALLAGFSAAASAQTAGTCTPTVSSGGTIYDITSCVDQFNGFSGGTTLKTLGTSFMHHWTFTLPAGFDYYPNGSSGYSFLTVVTTRPGGRRSVSYFDQFPAFEVSLRGPGLGGDAWTRFNTLTGAGVNTGASFSAPDDLYLVPGTYDLVVTGRTASSVPVGATASFTYSVNFNTNPVLAVPEPAEWAMMLAGLGVLGFVVRRRSA